MPAAVVWGIDIGHSAIKAVKVSFAGRVEISDVEVVSIDRDEDDETRPMRVRQALQELVGRKKIGSTPVVLSIAGNQTFFRPFKLPMVGAAQVSDIVKYEAAQQIPFKLEEVYWGWQHYDAPSEEEEEEIGVDLMAVRRDIVDQLLATADELGLKTIGIQTAPLALYNFMCYEYAPEDTVLVLDVGAKETDFLVMQGEHWYVRPLPLSGDDITRQLEQKFRMPFEEAEDLKLKMSQSKQAKKIFQVIEPSLRNLVSDVQRSLGYYKSQSRGVQVASVYVTGNSHKLMDLSKFLQQTLRIEILPIDALQRMHLSPDVDQDFFDREFAGLAAAIGLGLQGVGLGSLPATTELLPEQRRLQLTLGSKKPWAIAAVASVVLATLMANFAASNRLADAQRANNEFGKQVTRVDNEIAAVKKVEADIPFMELRSRRWARIGRDRGWYPDALTKVLRALTDNRLVGPQAAGGGVTIAHFYMSRTPPVETRATDWESGMALTQFGEADQITHPPSPPPPPKTKEEKALAAEEKKALLAALQKKGQPDDLPPDDPMYCLLVIDFGPQEAGKTGEGLEERMTYREISTTVTAPHVSQVITALEGVPQFKEIRQMRKYRRLEAQHEYSAYDEQGEPVTMSEKRGHVQVCLYWRYDDGTDIRKPEPKEQK